MALINGALAISKAYAQLGPIGGTFGAILAGIAVAAQVAVIASQPLAKGGIAYKPTLATIGEYPGARQNPEIVTPLSKLKTLLKDNQTGSGEVRFVIEGDQLVGILSQYNKKRIYF